MIRLGRLAEVDWKHVAVAHLLKWELQRELRTPSWRSTLIEDRVQIQFRLPSEDLAATYKHAVRQAITQTGLEANRFPASCPYTAEHILDDDFFPEARPS